MNKINKNFSLGLYSIFEFYTEVRCQIKQTTGFCCTDEEITTKTRSICYKYLARKCYIGITYFYKNKHFQLEYKAETFPMG